MCYVKAEMNNGVALILLEDEMVPLIFTFLRMKSKNHSVQMDATWRVAESIDFDLQEFLLIRMHLLRFSNKHSFS